MDPGTIIAVIESSSRVLTLLAKYYSGVKKAKEDIDGLKHEVEAFHNVLLKTQDLVGNSNNATKLPVLTSLATTIGDSSADMKKIRDKLDSSKGGKAMSRVGFRALQWPFTKKEVEEHIATLQEHKKTLALALGLDQTSLILGIDGNVSQLQQGQSLAEQDRQLGKLSVADGAAFDSYHRQHERQCVENTRVDLLRQVQTWNTDDDEYIFWLSGMAGTGKSTIARTVACTLADQQRLGASFFFSRGAGDLGHATKFVSTLAWQLACLSPLLKQYISQAIADHSIVTRQGLRNQWKELILKPLSMLNRPNLILTLVIDALDECGREEDIRLILQLFVEVKDLVTVKLKIFLTSRPETPIRLGFQDMPEILHQDLALHEISRSTVEHDICVFLRHELDRIKKVRNLPIDWPEKENFNLLVKRSDCLFIYIATACRFVSDPNWPPQNRLSQILKSDAIGSQFTAELDGMYMQILKLAVAGISSESEKSQLSVRFRHIVGSIVTLFDGLSSIALAGLLNISVEDVSLTLDSLHSVLNVPRKQKLHIRLLHPSFRDFLTDNERCDDSRFHINQELVHIELARSCLELLFHALKRDMCNLRMPGTQIHEIQRSEIDSHLSKNVQYACRYWVDHLEQVDYERRLEIGLHDDGKVHVFLLQKFLHWLEVLSLMGKISEGVLIITRLEAMLKPDEHSALKATIYDGKRFILSNRSIIEDAPLQIYGAALVFSPNHSVVKVSYKKEIPTWIKSYPVFEDNWSLSLQVLEGHTRETTAVAFSDDGQHLASGSYDRTVRLWDPATGTLRSTIEGHKGAISVVTFSGDGQHLASASKDRTVRLWDPATGTLQKIFEGHTDDITAVVFSGDGQLLASASADRTIRLWDTATGLLRSTLKGHIRQVNAVAFSDNGQLLISVSWDEVRLWDPATGLLRSTLEDYKGDIIAVACSGDGQLLASTYRYPILGVWDTTTGLLRNTFDGHTGKINSATFSKGGQLLASTSADRTIRLWDLSTGTLRSTLGGHTSGTLAVAFSANGHLLASVSYDRTVRLWDTAMGTIQNQPEGHTSGITAVSFSGDGQLLASTSADQTVRLWDTATGTLRSTLKGHRNRTTAVAFSDDGKVLASASWDQTIRLWDSATGALISKLEGHTDWTTAVVFSANGQLLASASIDQTVRLWDSATGMLRSTLEGHRDDIAAMAFSGDGQLLASASDDQTIRLWDPAMGTLRSMIEGHTDGISAVAFSGDGQHLASGSYDRTIRLWDTATGTPQNTFEGHTDKITAVNFSGDGQLLASASKDRTVRLWDLATGNLVQHFKAEGVENLSFSSDRTQLDTNLGRIQLSNEADYTCGQSSHLGPWMVQRHWLTWDNQKALWLPPDFRPACSAIYGNLIVIGHSSGRLSFLGLQSSFNQ